LRIDHGDSPAAIDEQYVVKNGSQWNRRWWWCSQRHRGLRRDECRWWWRRLQVRVVLLLLF
jgi:hypothetical protein